jgi:hypothetical protein
MDEEAVERPGRQGSGKALALQSVATAEIGCRLRGVGDPKTENKLLNLHFRKAEVYYVDPRSSKG